MEESYTSSLRGTKWTPVQKTAIEMAEDVAKYMVEISSVLPPNRYSKTMRRTVNELSAKHELLFKGMAEKLCITRKNATTVIPVVMDEVFADGKYNWGRIVMVYAFAGWIARHFAGKKMSDYVVVIGQTTGFYVADKLASWIENNGGWDGFEAFFRKPESLENILWCGLVCTIVSLGISALATVLIVR